VPSSPRSDLVVRILGVVFFSSYAFYVATLAWKDLEGASGAASFVSAVNRGLVVAMFLIMAASYVLRRPVRVRAVGFRERFLPFFCSILPVAVNESHRVVASWASWTTASSVSLFLGNAISVWALFYLRRAFSIMAEVRELVSRGPYRFVRHPIYVGQALSTLGCWLWAPSWLSTLLFLIFLAVQHVRALIEEEKMASRISSYRTYRMKTGAYFPKFRRVRPTP
jgi:protein-S-isoprenylcysteine O-methyltransferase Ste14